MKIPNTSSVQTVSFHFLLLFLFNMGSKGQTPVYSNSEFQIFGNKVVQGKNEAIILSPTHIQSNYQSPVNLVKPAELVFKFAINGRDNEMPPGVDHQFTVELENGKATTPIIEFGKKLTKISGKNQFMPTNAPVVIRLDFRNPLKEFSEKGHFTTFNGQKIFKEDFKGIFIAGATLPLSWDFDNLASRKNMQLQDPDGDGIFEIELVFNAHSDEKRTNSEWKLQNNLDGFPKLTSPFPISDALYNLALDEMVTAIEPDKTFRTGKEWAGVWTRDISYSIILSMAILQPEVAKISLRKKVKNKKIIQDTGTGGAWPVSTDRMIWAVAAYEIYLVTGEMDWLSYAFEVIKNSVEADLSVAYDPTTGLMKGESSFLDWREQTYPRWMQPADIFESECLGTNAVHYQANRVLAAMARKLNDKKSEEKFEKIANQIKDGINKYLWVSSKGYYGQFLYGRTHKSLSPKAEALGEALCVLFGIANESRADRVISQTPVHSFGIPCISPQIPGIPPYHNQAVWPFVQSYWALAAAQIGHEEALMQSIAAIYRPAALFATNKENFVVSSGDFAGTQINSSNMLWSLSGSIALVYKALFGIQFMESGLRFSPVVPQALAGIRKLENFRYRKANLEIEVEGYGSEIESFILDGVIQSSPEISSNIEGKHSIKIILKSSQNQKKFELQPEKTSPETPELIQNESTLEWKPISGAIGYRILKNGMSLGEVSENHFEVKKSNGAEFQVISIGENNTESFASKPLEWQPVSLRGIAAKGTDFQTKISHKGNESQKVAEISITKNKKVVFDVEIKENGIYGIRFRYANGNGPMNTENKCALRNLWNKKAKMGTLVFPQRGNQEWSNWGMSNCIEIFLKKGKHKFELKLDPENENMNGETNQALLDFMEVNRIH